MKFINFDTIFRLVIKLNMQTGGNVVSSPLPDFNSTLTTVNFLRYPD